MIKFQIILSIPSLTFLVADVHHHDDIGVDQLAVLVQRFDSVANLQLSDSFTRAIVQRGLGLRVDACVTHVGYIKRNLKLMIKRNLKVIIKRKDHVKG